MSQVTVFIEVTWNLKKPQRNILKHFQMNLMHKCNLHFKDTENPKRDKSPTERAKAKGCRLNRPYMFLEEKQPWENSWVVFMKSLVLLLTHLPQTQRTPTHTSMTSLTGSLLLRGFFSIQRQKITHFIEGWSRAGTHYLKCLLKR